MDNDDRIDKTTPRGQMLTLTCKNHTDLRWWTKNIDCIGARSIFFQGRVENGKQVANSHFSHLECECACKDLIIYKGEKPCPPT